MIGVDASLFLQLGIVIVLCAVAAYILKLLKQPIILAYVLVGILLTPVFHIVTDVSIIESMSMVGIAFLLFIVGLEMDLKKLQNVALISTLGGTLQVLCLFIIGYFASVLLGFMHLEAVYIGLLITFSSTMVVMKLLSDKRELNTLHGRIIVGILLVQDLVAIFALSALTSVGLSWTVFGVAFLKFALFLRSWPASFCFQKFSALLPTAKSCCYCLLWQSVFCSL